LGEDIWVSVGVSLKNDCDFSGAHPAAITKTLLNNSSLPLKSLLQLIVIAFYASQVG
jgi:hypothetical protein